MLHSELASKKVRSDILQRINEIVIVSNLMNRFTYFNNFLFKKIQAQLYGVYVTSV